MELIFYSVLPALGFGVLFAVIISILQNETLYSLNKDENGNLNPMLKWWIALSIIHVCIVIGWAYFLFYFNVIKLNKNFDKWWVTIIFFLSYWIIFESVYWCFHRSQHYFAFFGKFTGHKGELSDKFHHGMKPPFGPDYLTAFSAHPFDDFIVQLSAQSPWILAYFIGLISNKYLRVSYLTYGIALSWLVFIGMRAHTRNSFGGKYHCMHHEDPSNGPYSFSGIPEHLFKVILKVLMNNKNEENIINENENENEKNIEIIFDEF